MVFIRIKKVKGFDYYYLVKSQWDSKRKISTQRTVKYLGKASDVKIENIPIDDPVKADSFTTRPEKLATMTTRNIFNAKSLTVAEKNTKDQWIFKIRDSQNRIVYSINPRKIVTYYKYDIFNNLEQKTVYNNPLTLDLTAYLNPLGLSQETLENNLQKDSIKNRTTTYQRDKRGDIILETQDEVICLLAKKDGSFIHDKNKPATRKSYDASRRLITKAIASMDESKKIVWVEETSWWNHNNQILAELSLEGFVIRNHYNAFDELLSRSEFSIALKTRPDSTSSVDVVDSQIERSEKYDRLLTRAYDQLARKKSETRT